MPAYVSLSTILGEETSSILIYNICVPFLYDLYIFYQISLLCLIIIILFSEYNSNIFCTTSIKIKLFIERISHESGVVII